MGRKKKEFGAKEKRVYFRVSEALHEAITCSAKKCGLSVSEYCRLALINHPIEKQPVIIHDERKILQELRNINKVIIDLDQIVQYLNDGGEINDALIQEIRETLKTLDFSIDDFNRAVEEEYGPHNRISKEWRMTL